MKLRLEVGRGRRDSWEWFLRAARAQPSFRLETTDDLEVAVLEFGDVGAFAPFFQMVANRSKVSVYRDGALLLRDDAWRMVWRARGLTEFGTNPELGAVGDRSLTGRMLRELDRDPGDPDS